MIYNRPSIPKGARCLLYVRLPFAIEFQVLMMFLQVSPPPFFANPYTLLEVCFGSFQRSQVCKSANFQQIS